MQPNFFKTAVAIAIASLSTAAFSSTPFVSWSGSQLPTVDDLYTISAEDADKHAGTDSSWFPVLSIVDSASGTMNDLDLSVKTTGLSSKQFLTVDVQNGNVSFSGKKFNVRVETDFKGTGNNQATAVIVRNGSKLNLSSDENIINVISSNEDGKSVYGIAVQSEKSELVVSSKLTSINLKTSTNRDASSPINGVSTYSEAPGINASSGGKVHFTEGTKLNISVESTGDAEFGQWTADNIGDNDSGFIGNYWGGSPAYGIKLEGGQGIFDGDVDIDVKANGGRAVGVAVTNYFATTEWDQVWGNAAGSFNNLKVSAESKTGEAIGVDLSYGEGAENTVILTVEGDTEVAASTESGDAYGLRINGNTTALFNGNVKAQATAGKDGQAYAVYVDQATLNIAGATNALNGNVSVKNGAVLTFGQNSKLRAAQAENYTYIDGNLDASENGSLALRQATVELAGAHKLSAQKMTSNQSQIVLNEVVEDSPAIEVAELTGDSLSVVGSAKFGDQYSSVEEASKALSKTLSIKNSDTTDTEVQLRGEESSVLGEWAIDANGKLVAKENTKLLSMKGVNAAALVAWRDEVAYTNQRMEFLRDNSHAYGAWAQVYGGESAYDDASVDLTTTTVQVGADAMIGDWVAGAAFSYMNGNADMSNGQADTDAYTLSLYASRMFDSGLFVNGLVRYGRLSTDATAGNMDGSYDNNAFSVGGNVGYRFTFAQQAFVEPMFGLQYAYVTGDDYKASNGVKVEQDDFDALIASLGVRTGFDFAKDAGKLYARASVNHDFLGEVDGTASNDKAVSDMYVDLGGTWFTYGVGTQFNITDNLSVWGNVDRTTGGEVSTRYMMNAGLRYVF